MDKFTLLLTFKAKAGQRDALLAHLVAAGQSYAGETGTEAFVVHRHPVNADEVVVYERYASGEAQRAHEAAPGHAVIRDRTDAFLAGPPQVLALSAVGGKL
jgi:quinol monooxygenase YgiN